MIRLIDVTAGYKGFEVIKNINISFEEGSITSIIGKNGSGKSTLIKTASKLLKPFSGDVLLDGRSVFDIPYKELAKGFLFFLRCGMPILLFIILSCTAGSYLGFQDSAA